jgi:hypothetical protein
MELAGGGHGGGVRPSGGGGACFIFVWGGRRRPAGPGGSEAEKNPVRKNWNFEFTKALEICTRRF